MVADINSVNCYAGLTAPTVHPIQEPAVRQRHVSEVAGAIVGQCCPAVDLTEVCQKYEKLKTDELKCVSLRRSEIFSS